MIEGVADKRVLTDGVQTLELFVQPITGHNDAMILAYLPTQTILVEADAWTPAAPNAPPPSGPPNPFTVQLYEEIQTLRLDVQRVAALHGPGVRPINDLNKAAGKA